MSFTVKSGAFDKGWTRYTIMHKNRRVASVREDGKCTIYSRRFFPYNLWIEEGDGFDVRVNNLNNFYYWCSSRVLTLDRKYAKEIMNAIGAKQAVTDKDRAMIAISYHALCLTDVYWVKSDREQVLFEDISLYRNSLSNAFADVSLMGKQITAENAELLANRDIAGDVATSGVAPKAWIKEGDTFYLVKNGEERDVEAELLASKIASCFDVKQVEYVAGVFDGRKVSRSRLITDEDHSIVPFEFVSIFCLNHGLDAERFVLNKDAYSYHMMNVIDYLVGNSDRHWGNWGFTVDNRDNGLVGLHPLMDLNKAFTNYQTLDGGKCLTTQENMTQKEAAIRAVRAVGLNQKREVQKDWFKDGAQFEMFKLRLEVLKAVR